MPHACASLVGHTQALVFPDLRGAHCLALVPVLHQVQASQLLACMCRHKAAYHASLLQHSSLPKQQQQVQLQWQQLLHGKLQQSLVQWSRRWALTLPKQAGHHQQAPSQQQQQQQQQQN
jgi:hypothetical protein